LEDEDRDWTTLRGLGLSAAPWESAPGWPRAGGSSCRHSGEVGAGLELDVGGRHWEAPQCPLCSVLSLPRDCRASRVTGGWLARREKR